MKRPPKKYRDEILLLKQKLVKYKWVVDCLDVIEEPMRSEIIRVLKERINEASQRFKEIEELTANGM